MLQQTAAAFPVNDRSLFLGAAAARLVALSPNSLRYRARKRRAGLHTLGSQRMKNSAGKPPSRVRAHAPSLSRATENHWFDPLSTLEVVMLRTCLLGLVLASLSAALAQPPRKEAPTVRAVRLQVSAPEPASGDQRETPGKLFVTFRVTAADREFVGFDRASKIGEFTDDKGTDLSAGNPLQSVFFQPSNDHKSIDLQLYTKTPAPKARELRFKADLKLLVGVGIETSSETVAFAPGTETTVGPVKVRCTGTREAPALSVNYIREQLKDIEFEDGNATALKAVKTSGAGQTNGDRLMWRQDYRLDRAPAKLTVRVRSYKSIEAINVPADLKFGLGLE
jgi:hypothetical protein